MRSRRIINPQLFAQLVARVDVPRQAVEAVLRAILHTVDRFSRGEPIALKTHYDEEHNIVLVDWNTLDEGDVAAPAQMSGKSHSLTRAVQRARVAMEEELLSRSEN